MEKSNTVQELTSQIWSMADELRGNMDASEYRNYILGFIFYRYLSEKQEKYLLDNDIIEVEDGETFQEVYEREAVGEELRDFIDDISTNIGYAIEPEYTWAKIIDKIHNGDMKSSDFQAMFESFGANAKVNANSVKDFKGVFSDVSIQNTRLGENTAARGKTLSSVVELVDKIDYKDEGGRDVLGDIYEFLIAKFAGNSGKKAGEFYTPHEVSKLLAQLAVAEGNQGSDTEFSVYDFAMGSGSLLLTVRDYIDQSTKSPAFKIRYYGQELNTTTYNLARMNLMMHDVEFDEMDVNNADTLEADWPSKKNQVGIEQPQVFDAIVANPPYSAKWDNNDSKMKDPRFKDYGALAPKTKADYAFLLHGLAHLKKEGRMAIVLPHGVLFRGAKEGKIREALLEKNQIDAVIGLPANLFYSTSIPTVILVLKKYRDRDDVMFINAQDCFEKQKNQNILRDEDIQKIMDAYLKREDVEKFAHVATLDEIRENDYNLNIPRYVDTFEEEPEIDLGELTKDMQKTNEEIKNTEKELVGMLKELVSADTKTQNDLDEFIKMMEKGL